MINPSELRIGNIILFKGEPIKVVGIRLGSVMLDGVMYETNNPQHSYEYHQIPVSEDVLSPLYLSDALLERIRTRVYRSEGNVYPLRNNMNFLIMKGADGFFVGMDRSDGPMHLTPHSFTAYHQLQNIYYSMYGEELPIEIGKIKQELSLLKELGRI